MNKDIYNQKLDDLYNILINKIDNNTNNKKIIILEEQLNNLNKKIFDLEKHNNNKINILEKEFNKNIYDLEQIIKIYIKNNNNNIINIEKKSSNIIFYLNLLYIEHFYKNFKNINTFLFTNKFNTIFPKNNYNINKGYIEKQNNNIIIKIKKPIIYNIYYIILSFYNKSVLINNYNFNYILEIKKINNNELLIVPNSLNYDTFNNYISTTNYKSIYFYKIDQLIDRLYT